MKVKVEVEVEAKSGLDFGQTTDKPYKCLVDGWVYFQNYPSHKAMDRKRSRDKMGYLMGVVEK